jgi:hypothetical protein
MAQTITPVVHGGRRRRWAATLAFHVLGATLSAGALGAMLGGAGLAIGAPWGPGGLIVVATIAGLYALRELARVPIPIPDLRRQVPEWWRTWFSPQAAAFLYGLGLGVGFATHLRHGTLVAVSAAALATGDPLLGALMVAPFGLARSIALAAAWGARDQRGVRRLTGVLERFAETPVPRMLNGTLLAAVVATAAATAIQAPNGRETPVAAAILAGTFAWAAIAKVARFRAWVQALAAYRLPPFLERAARVGVPAAESAVTFSILAGSNRVAVVLALALLVAFSVAVVRARRSPGDRLPCGCFGRTAARDSRLILARNAALACLSLVALDSPAPLEAAPPSPADWVPAALTASGIVLAALVLRRAAGALRDARRPGTAP